MTMTTSWRSWNDRLDGGSVATEVEIGVFEQLPSGERSDVCGLRSGGSRKGCKEGGEEEEEQYEIEFT
jgi:hypothetical protein